MEGKILKDANRLDIDLTSMGRRTTRHLSWKYGPSVRFHVYPVGERKNGKIAALKVRGKVVVSYDSLPSVFHVEEDVIKLTDKKIIR